ncbi:GtrA family protein, partial [Salmonella enterica subsp. enterica serovar Montevideo]|nr:GtrA family protein [Salmonella enterica subsp. enterica serovar Montevideo]
IVFAFFTNKYFVFLDKESNPLVVLKQFFVFLSGRLFVFFLDISITFLAVQRYSDTLIRFFNLEKLPYDHFLFSNTLTRNFIGTPKLLNEFFWALVVQVLAIVINYVISKRKVFKKKD